MKAIIIGAGIGGLTAVTALRKVGIEAEVYERATALREVGAGISLWENALRALDALALADAVRARMLMRQGQLRGWRGQVLAAATSEEMTRKYGISVGILHRADLLSILTNAAGSDCIHLNHECSGVEREGAGVRALFGNGASAVGDVLIGADGLRSVVRSRLFGDQPPRYSGYTAWRAIAQFQSAGIVPCETWGPGRRFGTFPMQDARVYWYATRNAPEGERDAAGSAKQKLLQLFRGWHEPIEALLEATDEVAILRNDIYDREPLTEWSDGRVTLMGDAAHPMTPNLGQGACQAMEDAVVLAACLKASSSVETALAEYERRRIARTTAIVISARRIGAMGQWENPLPCFVRNLLIRATPESAKVRQITPVVAFDPLTDQERSLFR